MLSNLRAQQKAATTPSASSTWYCKRGMCSSRSARKSRVWREIVNLGQCPCDG